MKQLQHFLWQLPMLLGASTLLSYGARATIPDAPGSRNASAQTNLAGQVALKLENDQVYFSQDGGRHFERLPATPEAVRLKGLLQAETRSGARNIMRVSPTMVADGAGGAQWARPKDAPNDAARAAEPTTKPVADKHAKDAVNGPKGSVQSKPE